MPKSLNCFSVQAKATSQTDGELMIYGDISDERWWDGEQIVVPIEIDKELKKLGDVSNLTVRINSYGGCVTAGQAIISMISAKKKKKCRITTVIEGIAASMGSCIAMCGDEIIMYENALMMIHKPESMAYGNADDLSKQIEILNKCEETIIVNYMHHYNGTEDELRTLLKDATWLTAQEAFEKGLCTKIEGEVKISASANGFCFDHTEIPESVLGKIKNKIQINDKGGEEDMFNKEQQDKINGLFNSGKSATIIKNSLGEFEIEETAPSVLNQTADFLTAQTIKDKLGFEMTADEVISAVLVSKKTNEKATAYDDIKSNAIAIALKTGIKAKADKFDKERWNKVFENFSIDEINAQSQEWEMEAEIVLNAGKHLSQQGEIPKTDEFNTEDYQL